MGGTLLLLSLLVIVSSMFAESPLKPDMVAFGNQTVNQPSAAMRVTLKNTQASPLTIQSIAISGNDAADYAAGGDCPLSPGTLAAGKSCTISVTFNPSAAGPRTATLIIRDSAHEMPQSLTLTGTGIAFNDFAAAGGNLTISSAAPNSQAAASAPELSTAVKDYAPRPVKPDASTGSGLLPVRLTPLGSSSSAMGLVSIVVAPANSSIGTGRTQQFTATGVYSDGASVNLTSSVGWSSSAPSVATINGAGLASSVAEGSTVITASYASVSSPPVAKADAVTVSAPPIVVTPPSVLSGSTTLTVTAPTVGFVNTGTMTNPPTQSTATLLNNGWVLIAGGENPTQGFSNYAQLYNPASGAFAPTASMNYYRAGHTATLLNNGMVLIAGGMATNTDPAVAELYNPATGTFTPTGTMVYPRAYHTATLLPNGKVLIAGGFNPAVSLATGGYLTEAEIYDPTTGTFEATGSMSTARDWHTATLLSNGMVLIAGGGVGGNFNTPNGTTSAEVYNPVTGTFTPTGPMGSARVYHSATLLSNGMVLVAGGSNGNLTFPPAAELYNPSTGSFSPTGSLNIPRTQHTATLLNNGLVLVAGGYVSGILTGLVFVPNAELYDPVAGVFTETANLNTPRSQHTATLLNDGAVLIAGGVMNVASGENAAVAELYLPATLTPNGLASVAPAPTNPTIPLGTAQLFTATGTFASGAIEQLARVTWTSSNPDVISISNDASNPGEAWAAGSGSATITACAGLICGSTAATVGAPVASSITGSASFVVTGGSMNVPRAGQTATLLNNGQVLVAGGDNGSAGNTAELYDPTAMTFSYTGSMSTAREYQTATLLNNGLVLIAGGCIDGCNEATNAAELYNPATGTFTPTGSMNTSRVYHTATLLPNGQVLIVGGETYSTLDEEFVMATTPAELYDPISGTFSYTGSLNQIRFSHTATLLDNGMVLIAGGANEVCSGSNCSLQFPDGAELYNPATGTFAYAAGHMVFPRTLHTATLLNSGQVLIAGGTEGSSGEVVQAELYDPGPQTFSQTGSLNSERDSHTATLLTNGQVLIAGGEGLFENSQRTPYLASNELYDPATGTFGITGSLNTGRVNQTATLLDNGTVLIAGGYIANSPYEAASAEIYTPATLTPAGLVSISIAPANPTVSLGTAQRFVATGTFGNGNSEDLAEVTWSSSDPGVVNVSDDASNAGTAWAVTTGLATVSACAGTVCGSTTATVGPVGPNSVTGSATFTLSGSQATGFQYQTATLLPSGQVLIAGGADSNLDSLPYAELYDPSSGTLTPTGQLKTSRFSHTAALLNNGLVLIAGGETANGATNAAEIYNPATGTFTGTGSMTTPRTYHTSTLLANGQVLITGGYNEGQVLGSAELYDPLNGTFTATGNLKVPRQYHTATLLNDGTVLIAGGFNGDVGVNSAEIFNPATGTFTELTNTLNLPRYLHTATLLDNGQVLLAGGELSSNPYETATAEVYDPLAQTFTSTAGNMDSPRFQHTATLLTNGLVLVAGGSPIAQNIFSPTLSTPLATADLYDPATGTFGLTGSLNTPLALQTATLLTNGQVLIAGGYIDASDAVTGSTEIYSPATLTPPNLVSISIAPTNPKMPLGSVQGFTATGMFSGGDTEQLAAVTWSSSNPKVVMVSDDVSDAGQAYAAAEGSAILSACAGPVCGSTSATVGPSLVSINVTPANGAVAPGATAQFSASGTYDDGATQDITSLVNWSSSAPAVATMSNEGLATGVTNGSAVITASLGAVEGSATLTVISGGVISTGGMTTSRLRPTATLLNNGQVLMAGGYNSSGYQSSTELYDPTSGTFSAQGTLNTARYAHTATLLNSNLVLMVGGYNSGYSLPTAELYDTASGTSTYTTTNLNTPRYAHTATLLPTGQVLVAGGFDENGNPTSSAELYDPTTQTFTVTASLNTPRAWHTATLLNNGLVLLAGGYNSSGAVASAEIYNPQTNTFIETGSMEYARYLHTATLLNSGQVLLAGGKESSGSLATAEIYDPGTGSFNPTGSLNNARDQHAATLLNDGMVLIAGGENSGGFLASEELYDPDTSAFTLTGNLTGVHGAPTATLLADGTGHVLIAGGYNAEGYLAGANLYQPDTLTPANLVSISVTPASPSISPGTNQQFIATGTLSDGTTQQIVSVTWSWSTPAHLISNGTTVSNDVTNPGMTLANSNAGPANFVQYITASAGTVQGSATLEIRPTGFDYTANGSGAQNDMTTSRYFHTATLLNNGLVLITGGCTSPNSAELYNPATQAFTATGSMNYGRCQHTATLLTNGMVLVAGGSLSGIGTAELYNPATGSFTVTGNLNDGRYYHTATLLNNGMVLIAGGEDGNGNILSSAELYNPATGTFTYTTGDMNFGNPSNPYARCLHTATLLNNGEVLIAGGAGNNSPALNSAELYNPATGTFALTSNLTTPRVDATATLLNNGQVLVVGGTSNGFASGNLTAAELYDPSTGAYTATGSLETARGYQTATLLNDGLVLVAGGQDTSSQPLTNAELFDPSTGTFSYTAGGTSGGMKAYREYQTATLLVNGQMLITGGIGTGQNTAELY